jgi:DnaK suppressor protein
MNTRNECLENEAVCDATSEHSEAYPGPAAASWQNGHFLEGSIFDCPLSAEELKFFEELLVEQLAQLLDQAGGTITGLVENQAELADLVDFAAFESQRSTLLRIRDRESKLIRKIHQALNRIREGTFGICENCGEDIGTPRLRARPVTTLCIHCKRKMEAAEKLLE